MTEVQARQRIQPRSLGHSQLAGKVAVVLNGKARAVTEGLIRDIKQVIRHEDLYVSRSLEQWKFISRRLVNKKYDVVVCGGGDGTFSQCVTDITSLDPSRTPAFGVLRLGTGNAMASTLGSSAATLKGFSADLRRAHQAVAQDGLAMLRVEDRITPFAGVGLDSLILEDYNWVKGAVHDTPLSNLGQGGLGYAAAIATRSLWRFMLQPWPEVTIRNEGAATRRMDLQGRPMGPAIPRGGILYQGRVAIAAASTVPYYGLNLKLFPQALQRRDRFQLRVSDVDALSVLPRLPSLFRGEFDDPRVHDFFCTAVSIHMARPNPLQIGGDEVGRRSMVRIGLSKIKAVWSDSCRDAAQTRATVLPLRAAKQ